MRINKKVIDVYDNEFNVLIEKLKDMNKLERRELYVSHSKSLFPRSKEVVNLEDQISERHDYLHKFKRSFFIIGNLFFSTNNFGEYNQELFIRKTGYKSQRYPQKVILTISLLGYIKGMRCNYSVGNHGYIYDVDYWKFRNWGEDFFIDISFDGENEIYEFPDYGNEWLWSKQIETIKSMDIEDGFFHSKMMEKEKHLTTTETDKQKLKDIKKSLDNIHKLETLKHKTEGCLKISIDGAEGRLYSIMTRMKSEYRHNGCIRINGERLKEVDLSSAQPTLLGLMVKNEHPDLVSQWLEHCLSGDFYEWIISITGLSSYSFEEISSNFQRVIDRNMKRKGMKKKAENDQKSLNKSLKVKSDLDTNPDPDMTPDKYFKTIVRPLVKNWIMSFLYCKENIKKTRKDSDKNIQQRFNHRLCNYLEINEPLIFEKICWHREHTVPKKRNPEDTASELARKMQHEEVRYIKRCLKNLDPHIQYVYTVHDCIGCLESDVEKVKSIMEQTAMDMYGVKLKLNTE